MIKMLMLGIEAFDLVDLAVRAGVDSVVLDSEHGYRLDGPVRETVVACHGAGGRCLVRLDPTMVHHISFLADLGVDGVVLSGVKSMAELEAAGDRARFAPSGQRSTNPFVPAACVPGDEDVLGRSAERFEVWAMAETRELVDELSTFNVTGNLDGWRGETTEWQGFIVGPYDLSAALRCKNDCTDPALLAAVRSVGEAAQKLRGTLGIFLREPGLIDGWRSMGISPDAAVVGYDRDIWFQECRRRVEYLR